MSKREMEIENTLANQDYILEEELRKVVEDFKADLKKIRNSNHGCD